jgi:hypothetical protein
MFATFISVALLAAASVRAGYTIQVGDLTQCQDATIGWEGANGAVNIIAVPAADTCNGDILADLGDHQDGTSTSWKVALPAGAKVVLTAIDSTAEESWTGEITVKPSNDDSCVPEALKKQFATSSSAADSSSASSAGSSKPASASTLQLVATNTRTAVTAPTTSSTSGGPIGAVGSDPFSSKNGASRHATTPLLVLGAMTAILAASL